MDKLCYILYLYIQLHENCTNFNARVITVSGTRPSDFDDSNCIHSDLSLSGIEITRYLASHIINPRRIDRILTFTYL